MGEGTVSSSFRRFEFAVLAGVLAENETDLRPRRKVETCKYGFVTDNRSHRVGQSPRRRIWKEIQSRRGRSGERGFVNEPEKLQHLLADGSQ